MGDAMNMSMDLDFTTILFGLLFGGIGFAAWGYGRRARSGRHMVLGVALMAYSYFIPNRWLSGLAGAVLTALLFWP